jgi:hypothetical protein
MVSFAFIVVVVASFTASLLLGFEPVMIGGSYRRGAGLLIPSPERAAIPRPRGNAAAAKSCSIREESLGVSIPNL